MLNIENEYYLIRNFKLDDYEQLFDYLSREEVYLFEPGQPISLEEARKLAEQRAAENHFFAVIDKLSNRLIGHFSFFQVEPFYVNTYEIGFIFHPDYQGQGHATRAAQAFITHWLAQKQVHKIIATCNPEHHRSWQLLERLGFEREGRLKHNIYFKTVAGKPLWQDSYLYGKLSARQGD